MPPRCRILAAPAAFQSRRLVAQAEQGGERFQPHCCNGTRRSQPDATRTRSFFPRVSATQPVRAPRLSLHPLSDTRHRLGRLHFSTASPRVALLSHFPKNPVRAARAGSSSGPTFCAGIRGESVPGLTIPRRGWIAVIGQTCSLRGVQHRTNSWRQASACRACQPLGQTALSP
jgi:hypothetical protein